MAFVILRMNFVLLQIYLLADEYDAYSNQYLKIDDPNAWNVLHNAESLLKDFWATVKSHMGRQMVYKCFITGVLPLSLADVTSGFNIATNVSGDEDLAGLCGLSNGDIRSALKLCLKNQDVKRHFGIMVSH